ncbi:MAG TPA: hypothetical protein VI259_25605 [Gemmatimonadaceae bacterium]
MRIAILLAGLVLGARLSAQTARVDSLGSRSGNWSATSGTMTLNGGWTAVPDSAHSTVTGTWTLLDAQGKMVMYGAWSAIKATDKWYGNWRAVVGGRPAEFTGTWDSSTDVKGTGQFGDLFEKAVSAAVNGTWKSGGRNGAWAIRAAAAKLPPID